MNSIKNIIWDWNGTLLNDIDICIKSINVLLSKREKGLVSKSHYREIFTFPVKKYYEVAGFDFNKESFDDVAIDFIRLYKQNIPHCDLFEDAKDVLSWFAGKGYAQYMISAMQHEFLLESVDKVGAMHYFNKLSGIKDHLANGKTSMASDFCQIHKIDPSRSVFIGDTLHDHEVAQFLGMECVLVSNGHQSKKRLMSSGCEVVEKLSDLKELF